MNENEESKVGGKTRIFVTNIPKYYDVDLLKKYYLQYGEVTDVQVIRKTGGESRKYGFVGFKTEEEATKAMEETNNTFIDTSKIQTSLCQPNQKSQTKSVKNQKKPKEAANKDLDFIKSKIVSNQEGTTKEPEDFDKKDSGRILVTNLPFTTTEEELKEEFGKFGEITEIHICIDKETKRSKGKIWKIKTFKRNVIHFVHDSRMFKKGSRNE
jgi:RNA recognition motif-containing protein